jgi:hypothetical protein
VRQFCPVDGTGKSLLRAVTQQPGVTACACHHVLKLTTNHNREKTMRAFRNHLRTIAVFLVTLGMVWIVASFVHELSHGLTAQVLGGKFNWLYVWPGIQVWPHPGQPYDGEWGTSIAKLAYTTGQGWGSDSWQDGLVRLMGSGTNLLLAALALASLWLFRPQGWPRRLLIAETLMLEDILLYTIPPELFGLPHYFIFGGSKPEPVDGAELLGCPRWVFVILIVLVSALMAWGLVAYILRYRVPSKPDVPFDGRLHTYF